MDGTTLHVLNCGHRYHMLCFEEYLLKHGVFFSCRRCSDVNHSEEQMVDEAVIPSSVYFKLGQMLMSGEQDNVKETQRKGLEMLLVMASISNMEDVF